MDYSLIYITTKNREEAGKIGQALVAERLVACVNIVDGMVSIYHWEGKIVEDRETVMIAKTVKAHVPLVTARVKSLHSYKVPCIIELPVLSGNQDYLDWIGRETSF